MKFGFDAYFESYDCRKSRINFLLGHPVYVSLQSFQIIKKYDERIQNAKLTVLPKL